MSPPFTTSMGSLFLKNPVVQRETFNIQNMTVNVMVPVTICILTKIIVDIK